MKVGARRIGERKHREGKRKLKEEEREGREEERGGEQGRVKRKEAHWQVSQVVTGIRVHGLQTVCEELGIV